MHVWNRLYNCPEVVVHGNVRIHRDLIQLKQNVCFDKIEYAKLLSIVNFALFPNHSRVFRINTNIIRRDIFFAFDTWIRIEIKIIHTRLTMKFSIFISMCTVNNCTNSNSNYCWNNNTYWTEIKMLFFSFFLFVTTYTINAVESNSPLDMLMLFSGW